jgi:hypothetical protein
MLQRKLSPDMQGWCTEANLTGAAMQDWAAAQGTDASHIEEPGAGVPHAGICEGGVGNRLPYLDALQ